jgi:hypothetical protein
MTMIETYKNTALKTPTADYYETVRDAFNTEESVRYFFNDNISNINPTFRRLWPVLFELQPSFSS